MPAATDDTIVAVSSPPGRSRRGLVRLSGNRTLSVLREIGVCGTTDRLLRPVRLSADGLALPALCVTFRGPASYTGQDMAELQMPGHPALLDRLLHAALRRGARLAEPGEFTFRAFLAGKLDLTQAEGVAATIAAVSDAQLAAASMLREGMLGRVASDMVHQLADTLALVEAGIDFTDQEDVVPISPAALDARLETILGRLTDLLSRSRSWGALEALPHVVLAGAPSTGKSTLFNALLGRRRAVISDTPGTTRDALREPLTLDAPGGGRCEVMLVDVAGLDTPAGALDREAQAIARRTIERADLLLLIDDGGGYSFSPMIDTEKKTPPPNAIRVRTKSDLLSARPAIANADVSVIAPTGVGLSELRRLIAARLADRLSASTEHSLALQPRHEASLRAAVARLRETRESLRSQLAGHALGHAELVADLLRSGLDELAALGGVMTPDDVIGRVFATFCVGK
ncbi:MAG: 50S ribosome-binding GTPase [Planctomycetes bacterium]|nr:50S ribosome-binding GTPase [Planctomycetota bacterium]